MSMRDKRYASRLGELLTFHRILKKPSELTTKTYDDAVMEFQDKAGLLVDGVVGENTLWALQAPWAADTRQLLFERCSADKVDGIEGYEELTLREDAAGAYRHVYEAVASAGGKVTTSGGRRSLRTSASQHRSAKSMHYTGLAFDLAISSGFFEPDSDPFVVTRGKDTHWHVWCRAEGGDRRSLQAVYWRSWKGGKDLRKKVTGNFIDFTALCQEVGFRPIGPRQAFRRKSNRKYLSSEWWHFQLDAALIPGLSQFGIELLRIDGMVPGSINHASPSVWGHRKSIYRVNWF